MKELMTPQYRSEISDNAEQVSAWAMSATVWLVKVMVVMAFINMAAAVMVLTKKPSAFAVMQKGDVVELDVLDAPAAPKN